MAIHSIEKVREARELLANEVKEAARRVECKIHIGEGNSKTCAINEGTTPLVTCDECAMGSCGRECYAVWHEDILYPACRKNHAENTVIRSRYPYAYYKEFFKRARETGKLLRLNETGDFSDEMQFLMCLEVAAEFPDVTAIAYSRRKFTMGAQTPPNLRLVYSLYRGADPNGEICRKCDCISLVRDDSTTCPAQLTGDKSWHCKDCARLKCGCFGRPVVVFKSH